MRSVDIHPINVAQGGWNPGDDTSMTLMTLMTQVVSSRSDHRATLTHVSQIENPPMTLMTQLCVIISSFSTFITRPRSTHFFVFSLFRKKTSCVINREIEQRVNKQRRSRYQSGDDTTKKDMSSMCHQLCHPPRREHAFRLGELLSVSIRLTLPDDTSMTQLIPIVSSPD